MAINYIPNGYTEFNGVSWGEDLKKITVALPDGRVVWVHGANELTPKEAIVWDANGNIIFPNNYTITNRNTVTATAGQTLVNIGYAYEVGTNSLEVYVNGLRQTVGVDYTETSTTSITFLSPLMLNDKVSLFVRLFQQQGAPGLVIPGLGGTGIDTSLITGIPSLNAGTWNFFADPVDVAAFKTSGDGSYASPWTGWDSAITWTGSKTYIFRPGWFKLTSNLNLPNNYTHFVGSGVRSTYILFDPSANGTCLSYSNGASIVWSSSLKDLTIYSDDSTYTKVALDLADTKRFSLSNVEISGSVLVGSTYYWSGANSIGLRYRGRDAAIIYGLTSTADRPVIFADNPNSTIDADHFRGFGWELTANGHPCIEVDTGLNLTNVDFTNHAWVLGTDGLKWIDTTSAAVSSAISLNNIRHEQATGGTGYLINIAHNTGLQNLTMKQLTASMGINGIKLRNIYSGTLDSYNFADGTKEALNLDNTVAPFKLSNCLGQTGCTIDLGTLNIVSSVPNGRVASDLPYSAEYCTNFGTSGIPQLSEAVLGGKKVDLANNGTLDFAGSSHIGLLVVCLSVGQPALFLLNSAGPSTSEVADPSSLFSNTLDNAGTLNIYWTGSIYRMQNKIGVDVTLKYSIIGSVGTF